jgi:type I restriction enzyme R subunit
MPLGEADPRAKLIDPALHARGWTEELIRGEETAGAVEIRIKVNVTFTGAL